ncbi:hypothetical protein KIF53_08450 [Chromobacterium subtsugae]|uniref:Uncharacterized protein n=1 Tax=Chromobacterium subtsugae TaxID=251747 RepID=A0ABS7FC58_9NEIS|nr:MULTISPECIES: hypothetical protein [Chromobacterium]KUM03154.1 hypothetical protein Cv017_21070 [Chromobacterium subtsugae]KZE85835.1 hypothetical protein AWB61_02070 [Chromobacterium sp. F49]MBW7566483.1 hypothetical protein [Chromobacterium subtsugae]MBW8287658.1 hypothetical protein [Chromobacterium subtsugae]OBU85339.1 hypothetical protein MY55_16875 [Chromobacterium subtsugae]
MHTIKPRNPLACAAILKKGGAHGRSRSGQRQSQKQALWAELDQDWNLEADLPPSPLAARAGQDADEAFSPRQAPKETGHRKMACFFWAHAA